MSRKPRSTAGTKSRSGAAVNRYRAVLGAVLKYGRGHHGLSLDPLRDIPKEPENRGRTRHLDQAELDRCRLRRAMVRDTKNGEDRLLTLPTPVVAELMKFREVGNGLLFPGCRNADKPREFRPHWDEALKAAGIENFHFHDLRHSCALFLAANGAVCLRSVRCWGTSLSPRRPGIRISSPIRNKF